MADNIFSDVVRNPMGPIEPIPLQYLAQGLGTQEADSRAQQSKYQDEIGSILNITPISQGDAEVLQKAKNAMNQGLKDVDISDLHNPQNRSRINSIISSITNNPDVMAVAQRSATFRKMKDEKDKAESAGKEYINPGYEDAINYSKQGLFIKNKQFTSDGFIAKDVPKFFSEIEATVGDKSEWRTDPVTGERYLATYKDKGEVETALRFAIQSDPIIAKQLHHQFNQNFGDVDWANHAKDKVAEDYNKTNGLLDNAGIRLQHLIANGGNAQEIAATKAEIQNYKSEAANYKSLYDNPYSAQAIESKYREDYLNKQISDYSEAASHFKYGEQHLPEREKLAYQRTTELIKEANENTRAQNTLAGQEGQLINDNGKLRIATPEEVTSGKALPSTKSNILHAGGNPLQGEVKTDEIQNAINTGKVDILQQYTTNAKLQNIVTSSSGSKYESPYTNFEITPEGKIGMWTEQGSINKKNSYHEFDGKAFASMIVGKDSKSQDRVNSDFKIIRNTPIQLTKDTKNVIEDQSYIGLDKNPYKYTKVNGKLTMIPIIKATDDPSKLVSGKVYYLNGKVLKWDGKNLKEQ